MKKTSTTKKKLISAGSMLLVSAIALTTASYAWFSSGNTAKTQDIEISAKANDSLKIAVTSTGAPMPADDQGTGSKYRAEITTNEIWDAIKASEGATEDDEMKKMKDISSTGGVNFFQPADAEGSSDPKVFAAATKGQWKEFRVWFRTTTPNQTISVGRATNGILSATGTKKLAPSIRVSYVTQGGTAIIKSAIATSTDGTITSVTNGVPSKGTQNSTILDDNLTNIGVDIATAGVGSYIDVKVWVEGADANTVDALLEDIAGNKATIDMKFTASTLVKP